MADIASQRSVPCRFPQDGGTCGKPSRGRPTLVIERDGQRRLHWECDAGHKFHTLANLEGYLPCDCDQPVAGDPTVRPAGKLRGRHAR